MAQLGLFETIRLGDRVELTGDHPWAGHFGHYIQNRKTMFRGIRPFVMLDNNENVFVMKESQWQKVTRKQVA